MKTDWIVGWWSTIQDDNGDPVDDGWFAGGPLAQSARFQLISTGELYDYEDDIIVERVVGQFLVINSSSGRTLPLHMRLEVEDEQLASAGVSTFDLFDINNADRPFMWHKLLLVPPGDVTNMNANQSHPEWGHIDCRVNRRMSNVQQLVLRIQTIPLDYTFGPYNAMTGTDLWWFGAWLRVLVKH